MAFSAIIDDAYMNYLHGDHEEVMEKLKSAGDNDRALFLSGLANTKMGEYAKARSDFNELQKNYPNSQLKDATVIKLADTYFLEGNYLKAKSLYTNMECNKAPKNYLPTIYLRLAQIASKMGNWNEKRAYLQIIRERYPKSVEIKFADILDSYSDYFVIQVGAFGERKNAVALKSELVSDYPSVYIEEESNKNVNIYKVRIGKFKNKGEAQKTTHKLLNQGYPAKIYP